MICELKADGLDALRHLYFACPECGWCGPLRDRSSQALHDGRLHFEIKAATKDERR